MDDINKFKMQVSDAQAATVKDINNLKTKAHAVEAAVVNMQQQIDNLKKTHKLVMILPHGQVVTFPDAPRLDVQGILEKAHIKDWEAYYCLYATDNSLNFDAVYQLFRQRNWARAIPFARANAKKALGKEPFNGNESLPEMIQPIIDCLKKEIEIPNRAFRIRDDDEKRTHCDCRDQVDEPVLRVQSAVGGFLLERGHSNGEVRAIISEGDAGVWVNGELKENMETIVKLATKRGLIFHEPHHELTPGMLLIDEIFRRMVRDVAALVVQINKKAAPLLDIAPLQEFVNGLAGKGKGLGSNFGPFILEAGDYQLPGFPDGADPMHVDPSRIELFINPDGHIRAACVIVGAWKGGTHSAGHTSP